MKRTADESFDTPSPIALPSPPDEAQSPAAAPSPSPSSVAGPSRKRSRTDASPEERKEARAHRNRIAAQNSRDRRKAQFSLLEQRVSELEEENRQLRAGMGLAELRHSDAHSVEQRERDHAREKENEELRERIKTLESGWEAVMKALAATGLPLNFPPPPPAFSSTTPSSSDSPSSPHPPTNSFPVMVPPPILPISPATSPSSSSMSDFDDFETTCHSARVVSTDDLRLSSVPRQRVDSQQINFNWNSPLPLYPLSRRLRPHSSQRRLPPSTRRLCKIYSVKSSRPAHPQRRPLCLLLPLKQHPRPPWGRR